MNKCEKWLVNKKAIMFPDLSREDIENSLLDCKRDNVYPYALMNCVRPETFTPTIDCAISLTPIELRLCEIMGPERTYCARKDKRCNMIKSGAGGSSRERFIEINGLCGELSAAKMLNIYPIDQFVLSSRTTKDDCGDLNCRGVVIDIKTTEYGNGKLTLATWKVTDRESYLGKIGALVLFTGDYRKSNDFYYRGAITTRSMLNRKPSYLPGTTNEQYVVDQSELTTVCDSISQCLKQNNYIL
jgi:hypothetical protein